MIVSQCKSAQAKACRQPFLVHMRTALCACLQIKTASYQAGVSTASIGKFDKQVRNEKPSDRQPTGKRRKFMHTTDSKGQEHSALSSVADRILRERADDILDVGRAAGKLEADKRAARHKQKQEEGDDDGDAGKKSFQGWQKPW